MLSTADIHSLDFATDCIPFLPGTPPSSWAMVSQRFHSPLYLRTTNIFCSAYGTESIMEAGKRICILSLINLMPLYFGPHLDFLAELLGVSLHDFHTVHGSAAIMSVLLSATHALFSVFGGQWNALTWLPRLCELFVRLMHRLCRVILRTIRSSRHSPCYSLLSHSAFVDRPTSYFCEPIELGRCSLLVPCGCMLKKKLAFPGVNPH